MKAVILAGGGGTRLWPLSTEEKPKQFQKLVSEKTMLEETLDRIDFIDPKDIFIAINEKHLSLTKKLASKIPHKNLILEPALRDTASCIGLAAALIEKIDPEEIMIVIYADHLIKNKKEFKEKIQLAAKLAKKNDTLNIVEVEAKEPNTNYGYVKIGKNLRKDVFELDSFVEKPNLNNAKKFIKSEKYLWNTGIYVWKVSTLMKAYEKYHPKAYKILRKIAETRDFSTYKNLEKISIDYAIMEKIDPKKINIIKTKNLGWSDIGNWEAIYKELSKNQKENITRGPVKLLDCEGCLVYADNDREIRAVGLRDTVIIDTPEGNLTCKKTESHRMKELS